MVYYRLYQLHGPRNEVESFHEFDAEDDSVIPVETSEFPLAMVGSDGAVTTGTAAVMSGDRPVRADKAASEEQPGSLNVDRRPEGGGE